jgi:hypothetical protein
MGTPVLQGADNQEAAASTRRAPMSLPSYKLRASIPVIRFRIGDR